MCQALAVSTYNTWGLPASHSMLLGAFKFTDPFSGTNDGGGAR